MDNSNERIERLLVLLLIESMKGKKQNEKAKALNYAGFSNIEISEILEISPQVVANYLYTAKKPKKAKKTKKQ